MGKTTTIGVTARRTGELAVDATRWKLRKPWRICPLHSKISRIHTDTGIPETHDIESQGTTDSTVLYCTVQYSTCTVLYSTVQ